MGTRALSFAALIALLSACGARSAPSQASWDGGAVSDGAPRRDTSRPRDASVVRDSFWPPPPADGCVRPPGFACKGSAECGPLQVCDGCFPDPCCPECSACYPICMQGCFDNADCAPDEFCYSDACMLDIDRPGVCRRRPTDCVDDYTPVCACDGRTHPNACHAHAQGLNVAFPGECSPSDDCTGVPCEVANDCCDCYAVDGRDEWPVCDQDCFALTCQRWGMLEPSSYCLAGRCFLTDQMRRCQSDNDCVLHNDCCRCAALHRTINPPACPATCFAPSCLAEGVPTAQARCIYGVCRLVLP